MSREPGIRTVAKVAGALLVWLTALMQPLRALDKDPNVLWAMVHNQCVPASQRGAPPAPCVSVVPAGGGQSGYAIVKDRHGPAQYLLIPTARITGIESPLLLRVGATNYFAAAWQARGHVDAALHRSLPRDALSLAINSIKGRSQEQLHIHIDCLREDVYTSIKNMLPGIDTQWRELPTTLAGHRYRAIYLPGRELTANPIALVAATLADPQEMGAQTVAVVGADDVHRGAGFVVLLDHSDPTHGDHGSAEDLQDHSCRIAEQAPAAASSSTSPTGTSR
jgi:CDP-diacylglycerol pyrophosphatase